MIWSGKRARSSLSYFSPGIHGSGQSNDEEVDGSSFLFVFMFKRLYLSSLFISSAEEGIIVATRPTSSSSAAISSEISTCKPV